MKSLIKKIGFIMLTIGVSYTATYGAVLYEEHTEEVVTKGVTHINDKLLMTDGWRNVNVIKIDLDEPNVKLAPIESASGTERQTVLQMAEQSGAVAGVNADYFDMATKNTPSLGMLIKDGNLRHGYNSNHYALGINKNMGTFILDDNNMPDMAYYGVSVKIMSEGNLIEAAGAKNNIPSSITRPIVIDNSYYQTTDSIISKHKSIYSIVVENNQIVYMSQMGECLEVPKDGFILLIPEAKANGYYEKLSVGSNLEVEEQLYLNSGITRAVDEMKLGIGGSGLVMKDGKAYIGAAHVVTPDKKVARTVVATVEGSNTVLLITIDKNGNYIGVSQNELIEILKRYQVKDAMYFDGGGSTTCVVRNSGDFTPTLQNKPTSGSQRKVVNGLGVFSVAEPGPLTHLTLSSSADRSFIGQSIELFAKGTDDYDNPVMVDAAEADYFIAGITGYFEENKFVPQSAGTGVITAIIDGVQATHQITVSDKPMGIRIEPNFLQLSPETSKQVQIYGIDREGYKVLLQPDEVTWTSSESQISAVQNIITAGTDEVIGKLTASYKEKTAVMGVVVGSVTVSKESFETSGGRWAGNTAEVTGEVFPVKDLKYYGEQSLKMTYTFKKSSDRQIAYTVFDNPIEIQEDAKSINMWLYGRNQGHSAKIQIEDSVGQIYTLELADSINFTGWKYVTAKLPAELVLPARATKFYVYSDSVDADMTTAIYLDHVSITRGFRDDKQISGYTDYLADPFYKETLQQPIKGQYMINIVGPTSTEGVSLDSQVVDAMSQQLGNEASLVIKASTKNNELEIEGNHYTYANQYQVGICNNTKVIMLGTGSGGIRATNPEDWIKLQADISQSEGMKNIILITSMNPLTQFSDSLEAKAFHNYLKKTKEETNKNIFVVYAGGTKPEVMLQDGIRYIKTNGVSSDTDNYKDGSFIKFKMDGEQVYYTIEQFK